MSSFLIAIDAKLRNPCFNLWTAILSEGTALQDILALSHILPIASLTWPNNNFNNAEWKDLKSRVLDTGNDMGGF